MLVLGGESENSVAGSGVPVDDILDLRRDRFRVTDLENLFGCSLGKNETFLFHVLDHHGHALGLGAEIVSLDDGERLSCLLISETVVISLGSLFEVEVGPGQELELHLITELVSFMQNHGVTTGHTFDEVSGHLGVLKHDIELLGL